MKDANFPCVMGTLAKVLVRRANMLMFNKANTFDVTTNEKLQRIAAKHAEEVIGVTAEGHKNIGRGVVFIRVDPDTEECKTSWTSVSKIGVKAILRLAFAHSNLTHDLLVILPVGRLEGQGFLFSAIPRTPTPRPNGLPIRSQSPRYGYPANPPVKAIREN
jgi:hypothetical protein